MPYFDSDKLENLKQLITDSDQPLKTTEVVDKIDMSKPTAIRYLKQLEKREEIKKKGTGTSLEWYTGSYEGELE